MSADSPFVSFLRTVHAWAGAVLCLLVAVVGLTGTLLVFEDDYLRATMAEAREEMVATPEALGRAAEAVEARFPRDNINSLVLGRGMGMHHLYLRDGRHAYIAQDGSVIAEWRGGGRPEAWFFELHHELLLGEFGHTTVGISGIALVLFSITGVIIWWPQRHNFTWRVWPRTMRRSAIVAAHRNLGIITALPILVLSLTGAGIVFHGPTKAFLQGAFSESITQPTVVSETITPGDIDWAAAIAAAQAQFPEAEPRILSWPKSADAPVSMRLKQPSEWHPNGRTTVALNPADASIVSYYNAATADLGSRMDYAIYPLHAAFVGGRIYDVVSALSGLAIGVLGMLGAYSFLRWKLTGRRRQQTSRATA